MVEYVKPWLRVADQIAQLEERGVVIGNRKSAHALLNSVGYYRLTGYLYPFRESEENLDGDGRSRVQILNAYRSGTTLTYVAELIDFDRQLRMLVMEGVERIEIAARMKIGHILGRQSVFAHEDPNCFTTAFTTASTDARDPAPSKHVEWLQRVKKRQEDSDETFVKHFNEKYDARMPVWALTEILELGQLSILYRGINQQEAEEIAGSFGVPTKKIMASWLASLNYVRNVAAHHGRLFNRNLQNAPSRPKKSHVPLLNHLRDGDSPKTTFGIYNALAVIAYMLISVEPNANWSSRLAALLQGFPVSEVVTLRSMGVPDEWETLELWTL